MKKKLILVPLNILLPGLGFLLAKKFRKASLNFLAFLAVVFLTPFAVGHENQAAVLWIYGFFMLASGVFSLQSLGEVGMREPYKLEEITEELIATFTREGEYVAASADCFRVLLENFCLAMGLMPTDAPGWQRDDAILMGMMIRLGKLGRAFYDHVVEDQIEIALILYRCIYETTVKLQYLLVKNAPDEFDGYLLASSESEVRLRADIEQNIQERGGAILPIEERMLRSLDRHKDAGFLRDNFKKWKDLRTLGGAIGLDDSAYRGGFQIPSQAVHGYASDLFIYHLTQVDDDHFEPDPAWHPIRPQLMTATGLWLHEAMQAYVSHRLGAEGASLISSLSLLREKMFLLDSAHEAFLQANRKPSTDG